MKLMFTCECGNQVSLFATGDYDEHNREWLEVEDDDRLAIIRGGDGIVLQCSFCKMAYRI